MIDVHDRAAGATADGARLAPPAKVLIERHMGLAERLAARCPRGRLGLDDLVQVAYLALCEAAARYDVAYCEESFARFAGLKIRAALWDAQCAAPMVRMGIHAERAALRSGGGWEPYRVAVEHLGVMAKGGPDEGLAEAMALLPGDEHAVIELHVLEGFSIGQCALKLGITRGEARAAKARGLARLASMAERN